MATSGEWTVCPRKRSAARLKLFCFHYAGVGSSVFRGWAEDLKADVEVSLIQLPGREGRLREDLVSSITALVPALVEKILALLDRPFAFYGHSLGATVAFETALQLRQTFDVQPVHLFVGASPAPQLPWNHPPLRSLPEDYFLSEIERRYGALPQEVMSDVEMRALVLPILRSDFTMLETYTCTPTKPLDCDITAFGGLRDQMVTSSALEAWQHQTSGHFRLQMLDGDHFFLRSCRAQLFEFIEETLQLKGLQSV